MPICPICQTEAKPLDSTGDPVGLDCPHHGKFKVSGTVLAVDIYTLAGREKWEDALKKAKGNAEPGAWPVITSYDF